MGHSCTCSRFVNDNMIIIILKDLHKRMWLPVGVDCSRGGHKNRLEQCPLGAGKCWVGMRVVVSRVVGRVSLCGGGGDEELRSTYGVPREIFELSGAKRREFFRGRRLSWASVFWGSEVCLLQPTEVLGAGK